MVTVKNDVPQKRTTMPRTNPSCACSVRTHSCLVRFQTFTYRSNKKPSSDIMFTVIKPTSLVTLRSGGHVVVTSPSQEPDSKVGRLVACLAMQFTPSLCPSREARKGLANTLSSLVAFIALVYSLHTSNGWSVGS